MTEKKKLTDLLDYGLKQLSENDPYQIVIYCFSTEKTVIFPAFVTEFNDSFSSNWTTQEVYGRMDPVSTFKNTQRTININFDVINGDKDQAHINLWQMDSIIQSMYPVYTSTNNMGTSVISAPPLFRIKFGNLIKSHVQNNGLLGYLSNFNFNPDMSNTGHFIDDRGDYAQLIYPKLLKCNLSFKVIHEFPLGNKVDGDKLIPRSNWKFAHGYGGDKYEELLTQITKKKSATVETVTRAGAAEDPAPPEDTNNGAGTATPPATPASGSQQETPANPADPPEPPKVKEGGTRKTGSGTGGTPPARPARSQQPVKVETYKFQLVTSAETTIQTFATVRPIVSADRVGNLKEVAPYKKPEYDKLDTTKYVVKQESFVLVERKYYTTKPDSGVDTWENADTRERIYIKFPITNKGGAIKQKIEIESEKGWKGRTEVLLSNRQKEEAFRKKP